MGELVCEDCGRGHEPGLTGINADGEATCIECGGLLTARGEADGS